MPRHPDVGWQHGTMIGEKRHHVQCNYCHRIMIGGITRFKKHLASKKGEIKGCDAVPKDVRDMIRRQLATVKLKKGSEKKKNGAIVGSSLVTFLGDHAIDPNGSDISMNAMKDLATFDHAGVQASEPVSQHLVGAAEFFDTSPNPNTCNEQGSAPHKATDVGWAHGTMVNGDRQKIMCRYCQKIILGGGISRLKQHLAGERGNIAPCEKVPSDVRTLILQHLGSKVLEKLKRQKITEDLKKSLQKAREGGDDGVLHKTVSRRASSHVRSKMVDDENSDKSKAQNFREISPLNQADISFNYAPQEKIEQADMAVAKFFYISGIQFTSVNSYYFQKLIDAIIPLDHGYKIPSYNSLRGKLLNKCFIKAGGFCKEIRKSWEFTGCTVMVDRLFDKAGHAMISFYAYSSKGIIFLSSVDALEYENSSEVLLSLFDRIIQDVGPRNVVLFLTDTNPSYMAAAQALRNKYQSFFSSVSAYHGIELMLNVIAEMDDVKEVLYKGKKICQLTYNSVWILNSLRKETKGKELFQPAATEFIAKFSTLDNIFTLKEPLQHVFTNTSWDQAVLSEQKLGLEVMEILLDLQFWSSCSRILKVIRPLVGVLQLVDPEESPSIGHLYDAVEKARKGIISAFDYKESDYYPYLELIDRVREELHSPLHAAAYYLNPSVYYNSAFCITNVIEKGILDCIETLETNIMSQDNITRQKSFYENAVGDFSRPVAVRGRENLSPATWWSLYASDYPDLQRFAIRILSQTCSTMASQRNLIMSDYIQTKHVNKLESERVKDLTFVHYNLHFMQRPRVPTGINLRRSLIRRHVVCRQSWKIRQSFVYNLAITQMGESQSYLQSMAYSGNKRFKGNGYDPMCFDGLQSAAGDWIKDPGMLELENNSWRNLVIPGDCAPTTKNGSDDDEVNPIAEDRSNNSTQRGDDSDDYDEVSRN